MPAPEGTDRIVVALAGASDELELLLVGLVVAVRQAAVLGLRPGQEMGIETPSDLFDRLGALSADITLVPADAPDRYQGRLGRYFFDLSIGATEITGPYDLEASLAVGLSRTRSWAFAVRQPYLDTDATLLRLAILLRAVGRKAGWDEAGGDGARPRQWLARGWRRYSQIRRGREVRTFATELTEDAGETGEAPRRAVPPVPLRV